MSSIFKQAAAAVGARVCSARRLPGLSAVTHRSRQRRVRRRNGCGLGSLTPPSIFSTPAPLIRVEAKGTWRGHKSCPEHRAHADSGGPFSRRSQEVVTRMWTDTMVSSTSAGQTRPRQRTEVLNLCRWNQVVPARMTAGPLKASLETDPFDWKEMERAHVVSAVIEYYGIILGLMVHWEFSRVLFSVL